MTYCFARFIKGVLADESLNFTIQEVTKMPGKINIGFPVSDGLGRLQVDSGFVWFPSKKHKYGYDTDFSEKVEYGYIWIFVEYYIICMYV